MSRRGAPASGSSSSAIHVPPSCCCARCGKGSAWTCRRGGTPSVAVWMARRSASPATLSDSASRSPPPLKLSMMEESPARTPRCSGSVTYIPVSKARAGKSRPRGPWTSTAYSPRGRPVGASGGAADSARTGDGPEPRAPREPAAAPRIARGGARPAAAIRGLPLPWKTLFSMTLNTGLPGNRPGSGSATWSGLAGLKAPGYGVGAGGGQEVPLLPGMACGPLLRRLAQGRPGAGRRHPDRQGRRETVRRPVPSDRHRRGAPRPAARLRDPARQGGGPLGGAAAPGALLDAAVRADRGPGREFRPAPEEGLSYVNPGSGTLPTAPPLAPAAAPTHSGHHRRSHPTPWRKLGKTRPPSPGASRQAGTSCTAASADAALWPSAMSRTIRRAGSIHPARQVGQAQSMRRARPPPISTLSGL